jgi:hypothetical protein
MPEARIMSGRTKRPGRNISKNLQPFGHFPNSARSESLATVRIASYAAFRFQQSLRQRSCHPMRGRKSFPPSGNSYPCDRFGCLAFSGACDLAPRMLHRTVDEVARNGAFERINFGQRFSRTPLAFCLQALRPFQPKTQAFDRQARTSLV